MPSARRGRPDAKHQRTKPSPSGPNALPGARPSRASRTSRLQNARLSVTPDDAKERIHGARRRCDLDSRQPRQRRNQELPRLRIALQRMSNSWLAVPDRDYARALYEYRRARRVVFDELAQVGHQRVRRNDPAQAPAGHQPRLREAVGADHAVFGRRHVQKRRRATRCRRSTRRSYTSSATIQMPRVRQCARIGLLARAVDRPAGRIVG